MIQKSTSRAPVSAIDVSFMQGDGVVIRNDVVFCNAG